MPIWAYLYTRRLNKKVEFLEERVILLEPEVKDLKRKIERVSIQ